jgi:hypothetical protein
MKATLSLALAGVAALIFTGCDTIPPGAERGPNGTVAYDVLVESSPAGAQIEANGRVLGPAPLHLKIFGDTDGTFHDFGSYYYVVRALPAGTNEFEQTQVFRTGHLFTPEDRVPSQIHFDMTRPPYPPGGGGPPAYGAPTAPGYYAPPPVYYGPPAYYYGPPGPSVEFYFGPHYYHHRHW